MSDEELLMFFLMAVYLLEHNRQIRFRRMISFASAVLAARNMQMQMAAMRYFTSIYRRRQAWVFHRQENEFDVYYEADLNTSKHLDPNYWHVHYRMSRETFDFICRTVNGHLVKQQTNMRATIPVEKRVAVGLWWLANGGSYRSIGQVFGISRSIVCRITKDFVGALVHLRDEFICWPKTPEACARSVSTFRNLSPLPNVFGAIDGTHVEITAPERSTVDFFNRKQRYSIGCQGVCDGSLKFLSMSAGYPGSVHDSRILRNSWVFRDASRGHILTTPVFQLNQSTKIKPYLLGDAAYPLSEWLIKPFPQVKDIDHGQKMFNLALSQARVSIERAFGTLKGRWRLLLGKVILEPSFAADVVVACSVLHNICQDRQEPCEDVEDPYNEDEIQVQETRPSSDDLRQMLLKYISEHNTNESFE